MQEQFGYYLTDFDPYDTHRIQNGIDRKVIAQIDAFNRAGLHCRSIVAIRPESRILLGVSSLPLFPDLIKWPSPEDLKGASFLYIRKPTFSTREFINFLDGFRHQNPTALILLEVPTYPYDQEFKDPKLYFALKKDMKYRLQWRRYIDKLVDLNDFSEIYGIDTIHFINGINLSEYTTRRPSFDFSKPIQILFPASFASYQGCDLLIKGLANYYDSGGARSIVLHLAGEGPDLPLLQRIVSRRNLEKHVIFHGMLDLAELNKLYDQCTLGIASLALHRRSANLLSGAVKTREYLAKGLPFVYAGLIDVFEIEPVDFCLRIESSDNPVDIAQLIDFHDRLYSSEDEAMLISRIRDYAERNISMSSAMSEVISYIKSASY